MKELHAFDGIPEEDLRKMMTCFGAQIREYRESEKFPLYSTSTDRIGVILKGEADMIKYDADGYRNIIEHLGKYDIFGHVFFAPYDDNEVDIVFCSDSKVVFFEYSQLIKRCENSCACHSLLVSNVLQIFSNKTRRLHSRIETLSQRSIRNKLLNYFYQMAYTNGSDSFTLPFSLNSMADYLFVDRSAMLREMKKMREEELIESKGKKIKILRLDNPDHLPYNKK